jgi:trigger factor
MQVQVTRISPVVMELAVEVPADTVRAEVDKAYSTIQRTARIRGFRPGKAPRQVLARMFAGKVATDVVNELVSTTLPKALSSNNVTPVNQPHVDPGAFDFASAFSYKARFEVSPDVSDVVYEGMELERPSIIVTEAMMAEQIELLRKAHARIEAPNPLRPAQAGDIVTIDFTLTADGKPIKDGSGEGVQLEIGSGQVLSDLDAALQGKNVDDTFDADAAFPAGHVNPVLRGKTATFHVKVKDIKQRILPSLDDEFAKDVGAFSTLVELRANVHTRLEKVLKDRAESALAEQIVEKLATSNTLDVPPSLVDQQSNLMVSELIQNARRSGQQPTQDDAARVRDQIRPEAEKKVRAGLLMAAIAKKLSVKVTDDDVRKGIEEIAMESGKNVAKVRAEYADPQRRTMLIGMVLEDKVFDIIEAKAVIRDSAAPAEVGSTPVDEPTEAILTGEPPPDPKSPSSVSSTVG